MKLIFLTFLILLRTLTFAQTSATGSGTTGPTNSGTGTGPINSNSQINSKGPGVLGTVPGIQNNNQRLLTPVPTGAVDSFGKPLNPRDRARIQNGALPTPKNGFNSDVQNFPTPFPTIP